MRTKIQKYALISVFDKKGIAILAKKLHELGYKIISTGGTAKYLTQNRIPNIPVSTVTHKPECFDGRIKTISFEIEGGILFDRTNPDHVDQAKKFKIKPIDIVVCNLYPFEQTSAKQNTTLEEVVEHIDVGGPTIIRAAAKNYKNVLIVVDQNDYDSVETYLESRHSGKVASTTASRIFQGNERSWTESSALTSQDDEGFRKPLAAKAFAHLSVYDSQIASFLSAELFPKEITIPGRLQTHLRYGENPHQQASLYVIPNQTSILKNLEQLSGRKLSATNVEDINAGIESVRFFKKPCAVVIKHNNPCGISLGETSKQALQRSILADAESAFGGVIVLNKPLDVGAAKVIADFKDEKRSNIDIVASPSIEKRALELLKTVRKSMGVYEFGDIQKINPLQIKALDGTFILQTTDAVDEQSFNSWKVVTTTKPTKIQLEQAKLAWRFISRIRSNAIVIVDKSLPMTRGIGTGQTSRIRSVKIALEQAGGYAKDAILASDSFFPFDDVIKLASEYKIGTIIQQGGSINDKASIDACNKTCIPMIFTHRRAFWH